MTRTIDADAPEAAAAVAAVRAGDVPALQVLLDQDPWLATARITDRCPDGGSRTLLHVATDWPGHLPRVGEVVRVLVGAGAGVDARFDGAHRETALHWAASSDDVEAIDALLDAGADIDAEGAVLGGGTPLADATGFAQWAAAARLIGRGAVTTLGDEAALGLLDRVRARCEGDDPPVQDEVDDALWSACHGGRAGVVRYLHELGAAIDRLPGWEHLTPLDAAERSGAADVVEWLRSRGARRAGELPS